MAHPCGLCGCSSRTGAIIVGIVASTNYFVQLLVILLHQSFLLDEFTPPQYHASLSNLAFVFNHILLLLTSLSMLVGAINENKWLLLPFIIFVGFQDFLSLIVMLLAAESLITSIPTDDRTGMVGIFFVSLFNLLLISWILWIVVRYFRILHNGYGTFGRLESDSEIQMISISKK